MLTLLNILQAIVNIVAVATFIVCWRQLIAMQHSSRTQSLITLIDYLQRPTTAEARGILIGLRGIDFHSWTQEQRVAAERAISAYDVAGILIRDGAIPDAKRVLIDNWGYSIMRCHEAAADFLTETRKTRGEHYWDDFEWLAGEIPKK